MFGKYVVLNVRKICGAECLENMWCRMFGKYVVLNVWKICGAECLPSISRLCKGLAQRLE
jgi:hypothetical protein